MLRQRIQTILDRAVAEGVEHGCQCVVYRRGRKVASACAGVRFPTAEPVTPDTLFPLFSIGKAFAATAVHQLAERDGMDDREKIAAFWPEFGVNGKADITLAEVLGHRSGLHETPAVDSAACYADWDGMCRRVAAMTPAFAPGTRTAYQTLTYSWLVGEFVRRRTGQDFAAWIRATLLAPLGIAAALFFGMDDAALGRAASAVRGRGMAPSPPPPGNPPWNPLEELVNREDIRRCCLPGAGAYGTADAVAYHFAALGEGLLRQETLARATRLARPPGEEPVLTPESSEAFGLGYELWGPRGSLGRVFGHNGYSGASGLLDRETGLAVGFVKTDVHPGIDRTRRQIFAALDIPYKQW